MSTPQRRSSSFSLGALILIVLGVVLLLQNLGIVSWQVWRVVWHFWPVILILIGINIVWGRYSRWLMPVVSAIAVLGVVIAAVWIQEPAPPEPATTLSQPLQGMSQAKVQIDFGAGELTVGSLPAASPSLIEAASQPGVEQEFHLEGSTGVLRLNPPQGREFLRVRERGFHLETFFTRNIPLELTLKTGASSAEVDLTDLKVTRLRIETGGSRFTVRLPAGAGYTEAAVQAGAAQITIIVPQGVAARVREEVGLASVRVDTSRFPRADGVYESPGFDTAANRVELRVQGGVARVEVR